MASAVSIAAAQKQITARGTARKAKPRGAAARERSIPSNSELFASNRRYEIPSSGTDMEMAGIVVPFE
jgi:hypothetical protein